MDFYLSSYFEAAHKLLAPKGEFYIGISATNPEYISNTPGNDKLLKPKLSKIGFEVDEVHILPETHPEEFELEGSVGGQICFLRCRRSAVVPPQIEEP